MVKVLQNYWSAISECYDPQLRNIQYGFQRRVNAKFKLYLKMALF
ncbi:MAG: hypothetical protein JWR38_1299 [Mucilaginibacter sp.]|nr:hypothetical protein [Mucilaginibacter sp.]